MDFRLWVYSSCIVIASLRSGACAFAVEDDVIVDEGKSIQKFDREARFRILAEARDRVVVRQNGQKFFLNGVNLVKQGDVFVVKAIESDINQFDLQLFGQDNSPQKLKSRLNDELHASINEIDLVCELTPTQRKKLEMIGRADAKRLFDQVEELRSKARDRALRGQEIQIFRKKLFGSVLGEGSYFQKSLPTVLAEEQFEKYSARHGDTFRVPDPGRDFE